MTYLFSSNTAIINEVEVKNDTGNALSVSRNTLANSTENPIFVKGSADTSFFAPTQTDAFGRLRVSNPFTLFDSSFSNSDNMKVWDTSNTVGTTYNFHANTSCIEMNVNTGSGSKIYRQTKRYHQYQPGKSLLSLNTFVMNSGKANLRQRVGYFDNKNGIFLENSDNVTYIVKRSFVTGTAVDTKIAQNSWSHDPLNGQGNSGINLNITKSQIFWTDVEWLGVGSVRSGFVIDGNFILCHQFNHANIESNVYMTTATLPVRYEIENIGNTESSSTLRHICNTVISEGGYAPSVVTRSISTSLAGLAMSETVFRPVLSLRLKTNSYGSVVTPTKIDLFGLQTTPFVYKIIQNANVIGGSWQTTDNESDVQYNANATSLGTGGFDLLQGFFVGGTSAQPLVMDLKQHDHSFQLRANINQYSEVFTVAVKSTTNNDDALGSISWEEYN
jgi:hypothetical protein